MTLFLVMLVGLTAGQWTQADTAETNPSLGKAESSDSLQILRKKPDSENPTIIPWIIENANRLPPPYLYELARRLWTTDRNKALEWYAVGILRARYDAFLCVDATARQGITFLPMFAENVSQGIEQDRKAFGEAAKRALMRPDLFSGTASPAWICSHGVASISDALQNKPMKEGNWLKQETEWQAIRDTIIKDFTRYAEEQGRPQDDPVPITKTAYPRFIVPAGRRHAWLDSQRLVFEKPQQPSEGLSRMLAIWTGDGMIEEVASTNGSWCAGNNVIAYQTSNEQFDQNQRRITYKIGLPGKWDEMSLILKPPFLTPEMVYSAAVSWSIAVNPTRQSPFDCRWVENERLSGPPNARLHWVPLLPGDGFLQFNDGRLLYYAKEDVTSITLPIDTKILSLQSFRYFKYRKAYFISPVPKRYEAALAGQCIRAWWLFPIEGRTEEVCIPFDSVSENNGVLFAPTQIGWLRSIYQRNTFHGPKIGGVYLSRSNGAIEKIMETKARSLDVSPDGCSVAIQHGDLPNSMLEVIKLCP